MKKRQLVVFVVTLLLLLVACGPKGAPSAPSGAAKPVWQEGWDRVLAAAKQEGILVIYSSGSAGERDAMVQGMKVFGVNTDVTIITGAALLPRIRAERQAGLYLNDLWVGGYTQIPLRIKSDGIVDYPIDSQLVLPDVTDPDRIKKVWYRGVFPWVDNDHSVFITTLQPRPVLAISTRLVKEGEIKSYRDLLDPKWKGKIVMNDPTVAGAGQNILQAIRNLMSDDYVKELAATKPTIMRDMRLQLDWLAQGKVAVVIAPDNDTMIEFEKANAPVKGLLPVEGGYVSGAASGVTLFNKAANPNAAKVFINWITSKEGQELYAPAGRLNSLRLDVSTAHLRPDQMRQEGMKYYDVSGEAAILATTETAKVARDLFGPLISK